MRKPLSSMERDGYEKIAYQVLESPKFWFYPDRIKKLTGLTYWAEVEQVMRILSDKEFISKARESYGKLGAKYPSETANTALKNIKAIEEVMGWGRGAVPQAVQRVKEPWQMSISEFAKYRIEKEGLEGIGFLGFPHGETAQLHRKAIEQALREGKPVPKELLEFYKGELKVAPKAQIPKTDIHAVPRCRVPATVHPYAPPARQFEDEMEKLFRSDPAEFYRRKKLVNQAIKERERGKIKTLPDFSLTDLRRIKAHADSLYR